MKTYRIFGKDGLIGELIDEPSVPEEGLQYQRRVRLADGQEVIVPSDMLVMQQDGTYYLPISTSELERASLDTQLSSAVKTSAVKTSAVKTNATVQADKIAIPVAEELIDVQKRVVTTGVVRVRKLVHQHEEIVDEPLLREQVQVERKQINQVIESPIGVRYEGETMIIPVMEEVLVVEKRLMLKEELYITRLKQMVVTPQKVTLRNEEIVVDREEVAQNKP